MKPLLAHVYESHRVTYPCYVQPKLNGIRALYQNGSFQSREELPFTPGLLDHLAKPLLEIFGEKHYPLDGELYVHGWNLQRILGAVTPNREKPKEEETLQVQYHIFDAVDYSRPCFDRFYSAVTKLYSTIGIHSIPIYHVPLIKVDNEVRANKQYSYFISQGYEGMMYRLGDCPYTKPKQPNSANYNGVCWNVPQNSQVRARGFLSNKDNRCWHLLKRKDWHDDEFDFVSITKTKGELGNPGFILTLASKSSTKPTFNVGSGLTEQEVDYYIEHPPFGRKFKVKYLCLSVDSIPLNATILAIL